MYTHSIVSWGDVWGVQSAAVRFCHLELRDLNAIIAITDKITVIPDNKYFSWKKITFTLKLKSSIQRRNSRISPLKCKA